MTRNCSSSNKPSVNASSIPRALSSSYEDEFTYFKLPRVGFASGATGAKGRKAIGVGTQLRRIAACLDSASGAVIAREGNSYNVQEM
jgi:hypothetical protein